MTKEQVLLVVQEAIKKNTDKSELGLAYEQGFKDGVKYALQKLEQCNVSGALPPVDDLMQLIEKQCAEHITISGLRFYGTSFAQLVAIFEKFGYERKIPF